MKAKPIYLKLSKPSRELPLGASHFWGDPDLPEDMGYPEYVDEDGDELDYSFICQIHLPDIAHLDHAGLLPHAGLLLVFAKLEYYMNGYRGEPEISGSISDSDAVRVILVRPEKMDKLVRTVLVDDDEKPVSPAALAIEFSDTREKYGDDTALLAEPDHRPWENWDHPFEDWTILFQVDSFDTDDMKLNFIDFGVLDLLISPEALRRRDFSDVRALIIST